MQDRKSRKPSPWIALALPALVLALGGTAIAAKGTTGPAGPTPAARAGGVTGAVAAGTPPNLGTIRGSVVFDGKPARGWTVYAHKGPKLREGIQTKTDARGNFIVRVTPGGYLLTAMHRGKTCGNHHRLQVGARQTLHESFGCFQGSFFTPTT